MDILEGIKEAVTDAFGDEIDLTKITPEANLKEDLGFNSIGMLAMAVSLEEKFGFAFTNDDLSAITNVQDVIDLVKSRI